MARSRRAFEEINAVDEEEEGHDERPRVNSNKQVAGAGEKSERKVFEAEDGTAIQFHFHKSVKKRMLGVLRQKIENNGGYVSKTDKGVNTVLVDTLFDKNNLQNHYHTHVDRELRKTMVEFVTFVSHSIDQGFFEHKRPQVKGLGGRPAGRGRNEFTPKEDEKLCRWLAFKIPHKKMGGRQGLGVYQELVGMAQGYPEYKWAENHTVESWKQRYKMRREDFDARIQAIYEDENPPRDAWRPYSREMTHANVKRRENLLAQEEEEESEEEEEEEWQDDVEGDEEQQDKRYEDEDEDEDEPRGARTRKRRRSERSSHTHVQQSTKRQRTGQSSEQTSGKGKEKAGDESEEEYEDEEESPLFSGDADEVTFAHGFDEPGPSGYARSPERTLVVTHRSRPSPPSFLTQETLVNSTRPSRMEPTGHISNSRSEERSRRDHSRRRLSQQARLQDDPPAAGPSRQLRSQSAAQVINLSSPPQPMRVVEQAEPSPTRAPGQASQGMGRAPSRTPTPPPAEQPPPTATRQVLKKAARRPRPVTSPLATAPARNTRSRSRSVKPMALPSQARKRVAKKRAIPEEISEEEPAPIDMVHENSIEDITIPIRETFADEIDVEDFLMNVDPQSVVQPQPSHSARAPSMETDDEQTHQNLKAAAAPRPPQAKPPNLPAFLLINPGEVNREYDAARSFAVPSSSRASSMAFSSRGSPRHPRNPPNRPHHSESVMKRNLNLMFNSRQSIDTYKLPEPRTPQAEIWGPHRQKSVSSADSFPLAGTRAKAVKKGEEQKEKVTPYRPPAGTRAALLARPG